MGQGDNIPVRGSVDADVAGRLGGVRVGDQGRHAGEIAHDEGHQVCRHGRGSSKVGCGQSSQQVLSGHNRHVGQSRQSCSCGETDVKGGLHRKAERCVHVTLMSRECSALTVKQPYLLSSSHQCYIGTPFWTYTQLQALTLLPAVVRSTV